MIEHVTGDLFDPAFEFDAIGHGVNCKGMMGSGIAVEFRRRYPIMFGIYKHMCNNGYLRPGQVYAYQGENPVIYNIASQYNPGRDGSYEAIRVAMTWVDYHAQAHDIMHVGLPRIGAGIAGLHWPAVVATIDSVVGKSSIKYTLVSLEGA